MAKVRKRTWKSADGETTRTAWAVDFTNSNGVRKRKQFETKGAADKYRIKVEGLLSSGVFRAGADKVTVKEVADLYVDHVKGRQKRGERFSRRHLDMVEGRIWNYIAPDAERAKKRKAKTRVTLFTEGVGALKLSQLTARVVGDFRDRLRNAGLSVPTTRKVLTTLHAILKFAISQDLVATNAAHGVEVIGRRDEGSKKIVPPSKEALKALIGVADATFRVKIRFAAATGLRAGELHALRWRHLDFSRGEVTVETRVDDRGAEDVTKTDAGMRTVPLGAAVVKELREWKLRSKWSKLEDLAFPSSIGTYKSHGNMLKRDWYPLFDKLAERHAEDPVKYPPPSKPFGWHALRHFAVSTWIEAGATLKTVQTWAGHATLAQTTDRYGHLFPSADHSKMMDEIAKGLF